METRKRILIVDDEKNLRTTLGDILQAEGYDVSLAASGEEGVELCEKGNYDVVFLDVRMPGITGVETFRAIRRHREGTRVIMMSAYSVEELKRVALDEGAIAFLTKPLNLQVVINLIRESKDTAILVVADEEETANLIGNSLKQQGYRVILVRTAHDALELLEQIRFDLIFIDVALPSMNGLDLYLAIKKLTTTAVAVMITGLEEEFQRLAEEAVRQTAYTIVRKPLDLDMILELLKRITEQHTAGEIRKPPLERK